MARDLIAEGFDILECPICEKKCEPDAERRDGTIVYQRHFCKGKHDLIGEIRSFEINANGDLVE